MTTPTYESHVTCQECGELQTGPMSALAAMNKVAEKHTRLHAHATTTGLRQVKEHNHAPTQR